jgi:hypothetical protein
MWISSYASDFSDTGIQKLIPRYDKCLNSGGDYIEKLLKYVCIFCIQGRVSKSAVMDIISFLCVSLSSSTVQLHDDRLGSRCACSEAAFNSQNGDCA